MFNLKKIIYTLFKSLSIFNIIRYFSLKHALFLFPKIISSQYFMYNNNYNAIRLKKKLYFDQKYTFSSDWFSKNILVWEKFLLKKKGISYLEIGSFEGRSAVFILELGIADKIICVDAFLEPRAIQNINKERKSLDYAQGFINLKNNIHKGTTSNNCITKIIKETSDDFFLLNTETFDLIYIDGSHYYEDVKKDFKNSLKILNKGGILICDDFLWDYYSNSRENPMLAILECYKDYKSYLTVRFVNYQIIFEKIK